MRDLAREFKASLGNLLREAREAAGVKQITLGMALRVGESVISRWESGARFPTIAQVHEVARELKLEVAPVLRTVWRLG